MAKKPVDNSFIIGTAKGLAESKRYFKADDNRRSASDGLLKPDEVAGEYDISRKLTTMLGSVDGKPVRLTHDHLKQFAHVSREAAARLKKGVTAKTVIDLSLPEDRKRANDEIRTAIPVSAFGNQVRFMTDTGPKSDRDRHIVTVNLLNFMPVVASAIKVDKTGLELSKGPLQISCSCGRWRYWLAYLATKAGYNSGHVEDAFPKIRNPGLSGIACKHILRVMGMIHQSPYMKQYMTTMVRKAREKVEPKRADEKVADTREAAETIKKESWRQRQIRSTEEKREERRKAAEKKGLATAAKDAPRLPKKPAATRKIEAALASGEMSESDLATFRKFGLSDRRIANILKKGQ